MEELAAELEHWKNELPKALPLGGLWARSEQAHKWKATWRTYVLRQTCFWRIQDLLAQSVLLHQQGHGLGARILLRSATETLAILIHINQLMNRVLAGELEFEDYGDRSARLLAGSRNVAEGPEAINILTILKHVDKRYPGISEFYANLSETAHPNWDGLANGYSVTDRDNLETHFSNRFMDLYGEQHPSLVRTAMDVFLLEYNEVWPPTFEGLERWLEENDAQLQARHDAREGNRGAENPVD